MTEREWDRRLGIATTGRAEEAGWRDAPYEPTPYPVLLRLAERGGLTRGDHLLDYGCGKGRAVFFLAARTGCRATGIDCSEKLIAMAMENRRRSGLEEQTEFRCARAEKYAPEAESACFFFNPFSEDALRVVLERLTRSWYARPRRVRLFFYYPSAEYEACLMTEANLRPAGEIDCRDLFDGEDPREKILMFELGGEEDADPRRG